MIDQTVIKHHIQKNILSTLMMQKFARFRDMRPPKTDTNLYTYHLKSLMREGYVKKVSEGYTLDMKGIQYVDRTSNQSMKLRLQPKIITMLVIQDGYGNVLMRRKIRQPFIDTWTLPFGKVHDDDKTIIDAAQREIREKIGDFDIIVSHAGECYIRVVRDDEVKISTLAHVFYGTTDLAVEGDELVWVPPHKIDTLSTAPAIKEIVARTYFRDPYFFEEFEEDWSSI